MKRTIEEKISDSFSSFSLVLLEKYAQNKIYLYADFIELVALFYNTSSVSVGEAISRFKEEGVFPERKSDQKQEEQNQKNEDWVRKIFAILEQRASLFQQDYPFSYEQEKICLKEEQSKKTQIIHFPATSIRLKYFS